MLPTFLIIGAPRAGTTWLAKNLREHPGIFMPAQKELHYFDRHFSNGQSYYEQHFDDVSGQQAIGEATPEYLYVPEVAERIHALMPDCKMILSLRNPIDRVYSRYWNARAKYKENRSLTFEQKLEKKPLFLDEGRYFTHLKRFYQYFSQEQFLILLYDDIESCPKETVGRVFRFLNVDPTFEPSTIERRINAAADKPQLARSRTVYLAHKAAQVAGFSNLSRRLAKYNAAALPTMDPRTRAWLAEVYGEENRKLQDLTGVDVSRWA